MNKYKKPQYTIE